MPEAAAQPTHEKSGDLISDDQRFESLISLDNLRSTWRQLRREVREQAVRDPVDWLDWSVTVDATLPQLRESLLNGRYVPCTPIRYELAKSKGAYRVITVPNIRDCIVYRLLCDEALRVATPQKVPGAFFSRRHQMTPVGQTLAISDPSSGFYEIWKRYNQYRARTLLSGLYEVLVVTDISNYFDSIAHELLMEYLSPLGLPRKAVGLLGRILEEFKPPAGHSPNPRIGIPVDEFDCSRQLAHVFLFEHDRRIVERVGDEHFVRWMDDQNVGATSKTDARQIVNLLTSSLSSQRLTLNTGKTIFLSPDDVIIHFQLDVNDTLDGWEKTWKNASVADITQARTALEDIWSRVSSGPTSGKGNWDKVLKRIYGYATRVDSAILESRAYSDLVETPELDMRIFMYFAGRNRTERSISMFKDYCAAGESLYESTEAAFFESSLLVDADAATEEQLRQLASAFSSGELNGQTNSAYGKASALLALYWFSEGEIFLPAAARGGDAVSLPAVVARAVLAISAARNSPTFPSAVTQIRPMVVT